jgi:hypothetical protein
MRLLCCCATAAVFLGATAATHAQIGLYELARFDLSLSASGTSAAYIGSNPTAVGWNGSKLYVAGYNASGLGSGTAAIVEITNAAGVTNGSVSGFVTPTYSTAFGSGTFDNTRGYTGLAMNGTTLLASLDAGTNRPTGLQAFAPATNVKLWDLANSGTTTANIGTARVGGGPDFDPGYVAGGGAGSGAAWTIGGQGRRFLNDASTGAAIYTTTANVPVGAAQGMILSGGTTGWRDIGFNPATGDVYTRMNNLLWLNVRTGSNSDQSTVNLGGLTQLSATLGQNLGYMNGVTASTYGPFSNSYSGDLIVVNDRASTAAGQSWTNVIKFFTTGTGGGSAITPTWTFLSPPSTSSAFYDFEWDSATQTLAVVDFTNRNVSVFSTAVPEPTTTLAVAACTVGLTAMMLRQRRRHW